MPADYNLFAEDFKRDPNSTWIMKPAAKGETRSNLESTFSDFALNSFSHSPHQLKEKASSSSTRYLKSKSGPRINGPESVVSCQHLNASGKFSAC